MSQKRGINRRILTITLFLGVSVLVVWLVFYFQSSGNIRRMNERYLDQISGQIIERLETELFELENVAFSLSTNETVVDFITEENALLFHSKSAIVDDLLDTLTGTGDFSHILVLYNNEGYYGKPGAHHARYAVRQLPQDKPATLYRCKAGGRAIHQLWRGGYDGRRAGGHHCLAGRGRKAARPF
ncbi:hypothetical protein LJC56_07475 [Christensenellaceae bacterium OttesenSCG-928-K19]|nr:hypothetical protein [Christensenellaceae bacterium OttesenSCG-928-K19]